MQLHFFSARVLMRSFPILWALFTLLNSCSEDEKPQEACISSTLSEAFSGDVITLTSCNQDASDYKWVLEGNSTHKELHGQTVDYTLPSFVGVFKATLYITDSHGTSSKTITFTVNSPVVLISEGKDASLYAPEGVQLPNGNFMIQAVNNSYPYQLTLDNKFSKIKSSTEKNAASYLIEMASIVQSDGVLVCGRNSSTRTTETQKFDFDGNLVWKKSAFPSTSYLKEQGLILLIAGAGTGQIVAESSKDYDNKMNSYIHKMLGQGVSWSTKLVHTDNSTVRDLITVNGQYVVLSVDRVSNESFIDIVDDSGNIVSQKNLDLAFSERRCRL
jgi:hypothetical protein